MLFLEWGRFVLTMKIDLRALNENITNKQLAFGVKILLIDEAP